MNDVCKNQRSFGWVIFWITNNNGISGDKCVPLWDFKLVIPMLEAQVYF